jgi:hypothetical protein
MAYQRKTLPSTNIGSPAPLPPEIANLSAESLADLSASLGQAAAELGYAGQGFFYVSDAPPAPVVPQEVNRMQAMEALNASGKLSAANAAVSSANADVQLWWTNTPVFHRNNAMMLGVASGLGWTSADLDALFIAAGQIAV